MDEPVPSTESERTAEALALVEVIEKLDATKLTTWEMQTVEDIREGKAATGIRLRELRGILKRLRA